MGVDMGEKKKEEPGLEVLVQTEGASCTDCGCGAQADAADEAVELSPATEAFVIRASD